MNEPGARSLRNVAVIANRGAGKTSLAEAILLTTGGIPTLGSVTQGTTVSDFEPEEIHHRCSVSTSLLRCSWNHTTINLLDTPGALSLLGEAIMALQAADAVIVVLSPAGGIRSELVRLWSQVKALGLPCLIFVNELEKESSSTEELLAACHRDLELTPLPMSCVLKDGAQWVGVLDFVNQAAMHSRADTAKWQQQPVPPGAEATLTDARKRIQEAAAECDDQLLEQYLSGAELSQADVLRGLRAGVQAGTIVPLYTRIGAQEYRDGSAAQCDRRPAAVAGRPSTTQAAHGAGCGRPRGHAGCDSRGAFFRCHLQDHHRPVRRTAVVCPRCVRHLAGRFAVVQRDEKNQREKRSCVSVAGQEAHGRRHGGRRRYRGDREAQGCADRRHAL